MKTGRALVNGSLLISFLAPGAVHSATPATTQPADKTPPATTTRSSAPVTELEAVEVISVAPIDSRGIAREKIPSPVQQATSEEMREAQAINLPDYMRRFLGSVNINDVQNNPFQPDVNFRGFTVSPLLGLPQGLAVYFNGIRYNDPFGDTVNWDLIPQGAIEQMTMHSGSNAVYGLNALGGALAITTKSGFSAPGHSIEAYGGSWGRNSEELQSGWNNGTVGYYMNLRNFGENGWRDFSPTSIKVGFGKWSLQTEETKLNLTLSGNDDSMFGNGAVPIQLARQDWAAVFTHPDRTTNRYFLSMLDGAWQVSDQVELTANAYYRELKTLNFNGDEAEYEECEGGPARREGYLCDDDGEGPRVRDINRQFILASPDVEGAVNNINNTNQRSYGGTFQASVDHQLFGGQNRFLTGGSYNQGTVSFNSISELARFNNTRGTIGSGIVLNEPRVWLNSLTELLNWYFTDTYTPLDKVNVTIAGGYNRASIQLIDQLGTDLDGQHIFHRFNPSVGVTYTPIEEAGVYANYSESNRAPTAVELSCADPEQPCRLPNAFIADPPLKQVVAKTWEVGFRGQFKELWGGAYNWNAGFFHTDNSNDILFISSGPLRGQGYFDNVGDTLRQGLELGFNGTYEQVRFAMNYTYLDATFQTPFLANSPNNPEAVDDVIPVRPGDYIPSLPQNMLKASADWAPLKELTLGIDMYYNSGQYLRGDEANLTPPTPDYAVFNLRAEYRYNEHLAVFARIENSFNRHYQSFGTFGDPGEVLGDQYNNPRFIGVGAPFGGWAGFRLSL
jgi:outer membrane receptor protein involved in Fe transport